MPHEVSATPNLNVIDGAVFQFKDKKCTDRTIEKQKDGMKLSTLTLFYC